MARQPLISLLVLSAACRQFEPYGGSFDLPIASAVLQPEVGGPFQEPIGFVANGHGGQIQQLALKQGRFLTDDPTAAFLRTNPLPTGGNRLLTSVAVEAPSVSEVTVWAGDQSVRRLLRIPYLLDCASVPAPRECEGAVASAPVEQQAWHEILTVARGVEVGALDIKHGYTATETWTFTWNGASWTVVGSRSGRQPTDAFDDVPWSADDRRLNLTLIHRGAHTVGDVVQIKTRSGLSEHDVGGAPLAVSMSPDQALMALVVHDDLVDRPVVRWFDPITRSVVSDVVLAPDAWPHRLAWSEDGVLLVADRDRAAVWEIAQGDVAALEHPMPFPTLDVAALDGPDRRRLFVVPLDADAYWVFDRDTDDAIDLNPAVPGDQGITFYETVVGIAAIELPYRMPEFTDDEVRVFGRSVAISLSSSRVAFAHEDTGCLVQDSLGPRTVALGGLGGEQDYTAELAGSPAAGATLELDGASGRHVVVHPCAGIAKTETWTLRFDQNVQLWRVEGSLAGEQIASALEDERYLSDKGEVSFVVRAGASPSRDGWTISFNVDAGVASATGDNDGDSIREIQIGVAGDPTVFTYRAGLAGPIGASEGVGWYPVDVRSLLLIPGSSTDEVARVDPQRPALEIGWD